MAIRHFCDLCGQPAMDPSFHYTTYHRQILNRKGYHLVVKFTEAKQSQPVTSDELADCCWECMASGLERLIHDLRQESGQ